jgi:polar amino acid transport system substrate-binding protein
MYIDKSVSHGKYTRYLLRESYRYKGKVKHRTIANLSHCSAEQLELIAAALRHKDQLTNLVTAFTRKLNNSFQVSRILNSIFSKKSTMEMVFERKILRVGIKENVPGFCFYEDKKRLSGFDVDIAHEIARSMGVKLKPVVVDRENAIEFLNGYGVDLLIGAFTHYRERDSLVDFSVGYFRTQHNLLVKTESAINSLECLLGKKVGVCLGAGSSETFLNVSPKCFVRTYKTYKNALRALEKGYIDALVGDVAILISLQNTSSFPQRLRKLDSSQCFAEGYYALAMRQNDSVWRKALDKALQDIWLEGTWHILFNKWFGPGTTHQLPSNLKSFSMVIPP